MKPKASQGATAFAVIKKTAEDARKRTRKGWMAGRTRKKAVFEKEQIRLYVMGNAEFYLNALTAWLNVAHCHRPLPPCRMPSPIYRRVDSAAGFA